jgi:hypothetical protein
MMDKIQERDIALVGAGRSNGGINRKDRGRVILILRYGRGSSRIALIVIVKHDRNTGSIAADRRAVQEPVLSL